MGGSTADIFLRPNAIVLVQKSGIADVNTWIDMYIRKNIPLPIGLTSVPGKARGVMSMRDILTVLFKHKTKILAVRRAGQFLDRPYLFLLTFSPSSMTFLRQKDCRLGGPCH